MPRISDDGRRAAADAAATAILECDPKIISPHTARALRAIVELAHTCSFTTGHDRRCPASPTYKRLLDAGQEEGDYF